MNQMDFQNPRNKVWYSWLNPPVPRPSLGRRSIKVIPRPTIYSEPDALPERGLESIEPIGVVRDSSEHLSLARVKRLDDNFCFFY